MKRKSKDTINSIFKWFEICSSNSYVCLLICLNKIYVTKLFKKWNHLSRSLLQDYPLGDIYLSKVRYIQKDRTFKNFLFA